LRLRGAFTLIEVLISIALVSIVLLALYHALDIQRQFNKRVYLKLQAIKESAKGLNTLYKDILFSDGNISITKKEFDRLCIYKTKNSLYGLGVAQVCWIVTKDESKRLLRVEGGDFHLPIKLSEVVAVDRVMSNLELFDIVRSRGDILVTLKQKSKEGISFLIQGVYPPPKKFIKSKDSNKSVKKGVVKKDIKDNILKLKR